MPEPSSSATADPQVSVIIPTRDRPARLRECLAALARSSLARSRFEVIVVDDGGRASLEAVGKEFEGTLSLRLLRQPPLGPARARNAGAAGARGRLLAFTDDDCRPAPDWLESLLRRHQDAPGAAIGGLVCNSLERNRFSQASQLLLDYLYRRSNPDPGAAGFFASCNLAVPRDRFLELGGFDESYPFAAAEDRELCLGWQARGGRLAFAPEARVHHFHHLGPGSFFRQHFRYGRGSRRFRSGGPAGRAGRVGFERAGFYLGIVGEPFRQLPPRSAVPVAALLAVSQLATLLGFVWETVSPAASPATSTPAGPALSAASATDPVRSDPQGGGCPRESGP